MSRSIESYMREWTNMMLANQIFPGNYWITDVGIQDGAVYCDNGDPVKLTLTIDFAKVPAKPVKQDE